MNGSRESHKMALYRMANKRSQIKDHRANNYEIHNQARTRGSKKHSIIPLWCWRKGHNSQRVKENRSRDYGWLYFRCFGRRIASTDDTLEDLLHQSKCLK